MTTCSNICLWLPAHAFLSNPTKDEKILFCFHFVIRESDLDSAAASHTQDNAVPLWQTQVMMDSNLLDSTCVL